MRRTITWQDSVRCARKPRSTQYSVLLKDYSFFQKFCSDPYKVHTKKIKSDLVVVSVDIYKKNPIFLPGQKVFRKCQTRLSKERKR